jgi:small GTP-binding protein
LVWDLAGGEEFGAGAGAAYLRGAAGAIIVCDLTRRGTLPAIERYTRQMQSVNPGSPLVFVGNKVDLTEARAITDEDLRAACEPINGGTFFLTSAKTGEQVEAVFDCLAEQIEAQK